MRQHAIADGDIVGLALARALARELASDEVDAATVVNLRGLLPQPVPSQPGVRVDPAKLNKWQKEILTEIVCCITGEPFSERPRTKAADILARLNTKYLQPDEENTLWHLVSRCCGEAWITPRTFRFHAAIRLADLLDAATVRRGMQWVGDADAVQEIAGALAMLLDSLPNVRPAARRKLMPLLVAWRESEGLPLAQPALPLPEQAKIDNVVPLQRPPASPAVGLGAIADIGDGGPLTDTSHWGRW